MGRIKFSIGCIVLAALIGGFGWLAVTDVAAPQSEMIVPVTVANAAPQTGSPAP